MQNPKVEEPMAMTQNAESSPSCQRSDSTETFERVWNEQNKDRRN